MIALKDYLREKAIFFSPTVELQSTSSPSADVSDIEVDILEESWTPKGCHHDGQLVDSLLKTLDDYLQDAPMESPDTYDRLFEPLVDRHGRNPAWKENKREANVCPLCTIIRCIC